MHLNKILLKSAGITSNDLSVMITPRSKMTYCHLKTRNTLENTEYLQEFVECWVQEFSPYHSRSNNPVLLSNLILHFYLFNSLQNTAFARFIVNHRKVISHPVYQKSVFDKLALGVRTEFASRVEGSSNDVRDLEKLSLYLTSIADSNDLSIYSNLLNFASFGYAVEKRDIATSFDHFKSLVQDLNSGSLDDIVARLLTLNNRVIAGLDNITSRDSTFVVISETYSKSRSSQLGLFKFRNIDCDTYAIQEKGWSSYSTNSSNLVFIILNLFRPTICSSDNPNLHMATTIGGRGLIPNDVVLDMGLVTSMECIRSLFSMKAALASSGSSHKNKRNTGINYQNPPSSPLGSTRNEEFIAPTPIGKREFSTTRRYDAYFSRFVCLKHIEMVLL